MDRTASSRARAAIQSAGSTATELPHQTTVWNRIPRLAANALTATLPLCDTSATDPGSSARSVSPHIVARQCSATIPFPFGPHTGDECRAAASARRRSCPAPSATSPKPAPYTTAPPQPSAPASSTTSATPAAGIANHHCVRRLRQLG